MLVRCSWDVGEGLYCDFIWVLYAFYKVFGSLRGGRHGVFGGDFALECYWL